VASIPASRAFKADTVGETQNISCKAVVLTRRHHCCMFSLTVGGLHTPSFCLATESHFVSLMHSHEKQSHLVEIRKTVLQEGYCSKHTVAMLLQLISEITNISWNFRSFHLPENIQRVLR